MKEFIEKLIGRLEEESKYWLDKFEREYQKGNYDNYSDGMNDAFDEAIEIINQLAEEYKGGWIPCSERLPEEDCWAITCDNEGNIHIFFYSSGYFHESFGGKAITEHNERFYVPIAWQPLPTPYTEK